MKSYYCPNCGSKNEYELEKPHNCKSCGKPMDPPKASATTANSEKPASLGFSFEIVDNSSKNINSKNNPKLPSFKISGGSPLIQTLGDIKSQVETNPEIKNQKINRKKEKSLSKDEVLREFRKEASGKSKSMEVGLDS